MSEIKFTAIYEKAEEGGYIGGKMITLPLYRKVKDFLAKKICDDVGIK